VRRERAQRIACSRFLDLNSGGDAEPSQASSCCNPGAAENLSRPGRDLHVPSSTLPERNELRYRSVMVRDTRLLIYAGLQLSHVSAWDFSKPGLKNNFVMSSPIDLVQLPFLTIHLQQARVGIIVCHNFGAKLKFP
jgi:hypothetical protein